MQRMKVIQVECYQANPFDLRIYHLRHISSDGLMIPSYLLTAPDDTAFSASVVYIPPSKYGGIIQYGSTKYNENIIATSQWFISRGLFVYIIDRRGAWGYGEEYIRKADMFGLDVDDIVTGTVSMLEIGMLPPPRILFGYCSGGTLGALVLRKHGIFSKAFFASSFFDIQRQFTRRTGFGKWDAFLKKTYPEFVESLSPDQRSPLLFTEQMDPCCEIHLFHGKNDEIVLPEQSEVFYDLLKKKGKEVRLHIREDFRHDRNYAAPNQSHTKWLWDIVDKAISNLT